MFTKLSQNVCLTNTHILMYWYARFNCKLWNIFWFCCDRSKTLPYVWKKYLKNERYLCLVTHSFTKHSQNVCLINTHILVNRYPRCDCKLWNASWSYRVFWVFSYIGDEHSCLKYCIFTKLSQIVYPINVHILVCQHARCDCRLWKILWFYAFLENFHV